MRGVHWYIVGSLVLVALAGCGRSFMVAEREPWRREAEEQCLKSGAVKESPAVAIQKPIKGPGSCGADYPLRVAAFGEGSVFGYADEAIRPPGSVPQGNSNPLAYPRPPVAATPLPAPQPMAAPQPLPGPRYDGEPQYEQINPYRDPPYTQRPTYAPYPEQPPYSEPPRYTPPGTARTPMPLTPVGVAPPREEAPGSYALPPPSYGEPRQAYPPAPTPYERQPYSERPTIVPQSPAPAASVPLGRARGAPVTRPVAAAVTPAATLACPMVSALDQWIAGSVQPAAQKWFGQPVVEIKQISAYSCRGMNGNPNSRISEHAFGNALDISAFTLADGRKVTVKQGWQGAPEEQGFLRDIEAAACEQFSTVLAPGSNVYHYDHIHVDLMRRGSGQAICNPAAMPGEVAAARARSRYAGHGRGEPRVTGSIGVQHAQKPATPAARNAELRDDIDDDLPHPLPGLDRNY